MRPQPRYKPGDEIGGRLLVGQVLMGGMGEVYLCLDLEQNLPVALKTFQARYLANLKFFGKLLEAFHTEAATWVALEKHPNIVRCFGMDIINNQPFMLLEWIAGDETRGTDLRSWLRRGPLDLRLALDFAIDICRGLVHAAQKQPGIVHRDLKPDNVLVAQERIAKITDFGLAKIVQDADLAIPDAANEPDGRQSLLGANGIVGTPSYMAPEQWRSEELDARTDVYAIGCMLYELLAGYRPFTATTIEGLRRQHQEAAIPRLPTNRDLPAILDILLSRCLAKRREERVATVSELLEELSQIYQQQFSEAPKITPVGAKFDASEYSSRGVTYHHLHRLDEALADHNRAIQIAPSFAGLYNNRGATYIELRRSDEALEDFTRAIQLDTSFASAYNNRGLTYTELGRFDEALADFDHAIALDPTYPKAYNNRGRTYAELGRYEEALEDFTRAIEIDPVYLKSYTGRSLVYRSLQRHEEALADLTRAIQIDPSLTYAYGERGNMHRQLQQYDRALADFGRVLELDPMSGKAYAQRGHTYAELRRFDEALADYSRAIELDPTSAETHTNRGVTYLHLQRYNEALTDLSRAIQLDPTYAPAYGNRGAIYEKLQRYYEALEDHNRAIQLDPTEAQEYYNRGVAYLRLQRCDEALADLTRAIELDPTIAPAYLNIGVILYSRGTLKEALPYFEKAAQHDLPEGRLYAAKVRQDIGSQDDSEVDLTRLLMEASLDAFLGANSPDEMQQVAAQFPFMTDPVFIATIEHGVVQQQPPSFKPAFEQRLTWLRQIARQQK